MRLLLGGEQFLPQLVLLSAQPVFLRLLSLSLQRLLPLLLLPGGASELLETVAGRLDGRQRRGRGLLCQAGPRAHVLQLDVLQWHHGAQSSVTWMTGVKLTTQARCYSKHVLLENYKPQTDAVTEGHYCELTSDSWF